MSAINQNNSKLLGWTEGEPKAHDMGAWVQDMFIPGGSHVITQSLMAPYSIDVPWDRFDYSFRINE